MPTSPTPRRKIASLERTAAEIAAAQAAGKTVVHCHGVFDPLHLGHIRHFEAARKFGELLVVTVTPDRFVNKGPHRPIFPEELRAEAVAAVEHVDLVAVNEWPMAIETIRTLRPNVFVKGSEFRGGQDLTGAIQLEKQAVESVGGRLDFTDEVTYSASNLVNRHLAVFAPETTRYLAEFALRYPTADVLRYLEAARDLKVLVVGETIIDDYQYVDAIGKSSKEPTLVVKALESEQFAGGAAAVANHVAGFCDRVVLQTLLGATRPQEEFLRSKLRANIEPRFLYRADAPTIVKRRFVEQYHRYKLFEVYEINDAVPSEAESAAWTEALAGQLDEFDLVIATDYGHGFLTPSMIERLCRESRFLAVNTQSNAGNLGYHVISNYPRADFLSIAENEMRLEARDRRGPVEPMIERIAERLQCPQVMVTRGSRGCLGYRPGAGFTAVPAFATRIVDRIGAGDAFLSMTALCAVQQAPMDILGLIGNVAGAQAVATMGNKETLERVPFLRHLEHLLK